MKSGKGIVYLPFSDCDRVGLLKRVSSMRNSSVEEKAFPQFIQKLALRGEGLPQEAHFTEAENIVKTIDK